MDTPVLIYALEQHPQFGPASSELFRAISRGEVSAVMSTLAISETMVIPYRRGLATAADQYIAELLNLSGLNVQAPSLQICLTAARLRADHRSMKLPDAVHLATAIELGATAFVTNDRRIPGNAPIEIVQLGRLGG